MELNYVKNLNNLPGNLNYGLFICDTSGKLLNCNETFFHKLGYSNKTEILQKHSGEIYFKDSNDSFISHLGNTDTITSNNVQFFNKEGTVITLTINSFKNKDNKENDYFVNYCEDTTLFNEQLKNNDKLFDSIVASSNNGLLLFEFNVQQKEFEIIYSNVVARAYLSESITKKYLAKVFHFIELEKINEIQKSGHLSFDWLLNINNTDIIYYLTINFSLINNKTQDKPVISVNIVDNTKQYQKLNELEIQLKENISLLSEMNHRINNNLNIIDSIIEINKIKLNDGYTLNKLSDIQLKIKSIALVYQKSNYSTNINYINVKNYITEIANYFKKSFNNDGFKTIEIKTNIHSEINLKPVKAQQLGLLISELMFNSYKYGNKKSDIIIKINISCNENTLIMNYTDSGKGLPINVMDLKSGNFGFKLIESLIKQLNGTYKLPVSKNFEFNLEFKK
jgi:two-component sensor histidine kinase